MAHGASPTYRFGDLLALARRAWVMAVREQMAAAGYPGYRQTDAVLLRVLAGRALAIGELGEALGVTRQAARKLASGLVSRGHAAFEPDPADGRRTLVALTPAGSAYGRAVAEVQDQLNAAVVARVPTEQLAAADAVLRSLLSDDEARRRVDRLVAPPTT